MHFILITLLGVNTLYLIYHLMIDDVGSPEQAITEQADAVAGIRLLGEGKSASADYLSSLRTQDIETPAAEERPMSRQQSAPPSAPAPTPAPAQKQAGPEQQVGDSASPSKLAPAESTVGIDVTQVPAVKAPVPQPSGGVNQDQVSERYLDETAVVAGGPVAKPLAEVGVDSLASITNGGGSNAAPFAVASPTQTRLCLKVGPIPTESKASALVKSLRLMDFDASLTEGEWQRAEEYRVIVKAPAEAEAKTELESNLRAAGFRPEWLGSGKFAGNLQVGKPETRADADSLQNQTIESGFPAEIYVETRISMDYFVLVAKGQSLENPQETVKTFGYPEKSIKISFDGCKTFALSE